MVDKKYRSLLWYRITTMYLSARRHRWTTSLQLARDLAAVSERRISRKTVYNRLAKIGLYTCVQSADIRRMDLPSRSPNPNSVEYICDGVGKVISIVVVVPGTPPAGNKSSAFGRRDFVATDTY
ncbi:hypothetical protein TNCV_5049981 [Trichonephila clavipes]|nr:hypothetical protein TNCV_5049981 [Trichonephila clavipes]